jgi:HAD superfamily hydrolase (TIGR01484 family)
MKYKLIALDLDGTLLHRGQVSEENAKWIRTALEIGAYVVLATGRPIREVAPIVEALHLKHPLVVNNGSEVWKSPDELHVRHVIDSIWIKRILELIKKYDKEVSGWAHTVGNTINLTNVPDHLDSFLWLQLAVCSDDPMCLLKIREEVQTWDVLEISNSHITNIEFNPYGVNKATGLHEVCNYLGVSMSEVIAIGDSLNDISMIQEAGLGVAMGNAQEQVKMAAKFIAPSNDHDGVAEVIKTYILGIS